MPRTVQVHTVLSAEQLKFRAMRGHEGLSQLFEFEVDMVSTSFNLDLKRLLGTSLTLAIADDGTTRYLNGTVVRFELVGRANETGRHYIYRALVQPWLWYLTRTTDCRIFQNQSVPEVLDAVLGKYGFQFEKRLTGSYRPWEYCVQYQESDFAFVSRLMEHEGIAYHFEHGNGSHLLVLADDTGGYHPLPGHARIPYRPRDRVVNALEPCIDRWRVAEQITSGRVMLDDFDFKKSRASLQSVQQDPKGHDHATYEVYEWLGGYSEHQQGDAYAKIRLQELQCAHELASGHTNVVGMAPGHLFEMTHCPREADNREYLVTGTRYDLREPEYSTGGSSESVCEFDFTVLPSAVPYRPARTTPRPRTNGPQTATVVGPEEIWTDRFGRVKLQFRWDRYGQSDENSSCWVRVSSNWAGANYGTMHMPRVGQEVIVDFIGGQPDRPIITGRVYNSDQMPPWELPANATASGILTRSSTGGAANQANMLRFEDRTGAEQILLHAERNLDVEVEADETHTTDGTRTTLIKGHEFRHLPGRRDARHHRGRDGNHHRRRHARRDRRLQRNRERRRDAAHHGRQDAHAQRRAQRHHLRRRDPRHQRRLQRHHRRPGNPLRERGPQRHHQHVEHRACERSVEHHGDRPHGPHLAGRDLQHHEPHPQHDAARDQHERLQHDVQGLQEHHERLHEQLEDLHQQLRQEQRLALVPRGGRGGAFLGGRAGARPVGAAPAELHPQLAVLWHPARRGRCSARRTQRPRSRGRCSRSRTSA
ncbi:type VI secretion system Vgr family protein [Variovorax boronicumulans]|uniref:type VI secretion system Vgr family protein n=1 Tax=Variovorax boronicumulans TaxID=436515 RepID=UPI0036F30C7A